MADKVWMGYVRVNGPAGIHDKVLMIHAVKRSTFVAKKIMKLADDSGTEVVGLPGCTDNKYAVRLPTSLIRYPNIGGALVAGLGREYIQPQRLVDTAAREEKEVVWMSIQGQGGTKSSIDQSLVLVKHMERATENIPGKPMRLGGLVIGAECGGSDSASSLAGDIVVGRLFNQLADVGGTTVFGEIMEAVGLEHTLAGWAAGREAAEDLAATYDGMLEYRRSVRRYSVSPGNSMGGLFTTEEKSTKAMAKSGNRPIQGVLKVGGCSPKPGLWLLGSTPNPHRMQFGVADPNDSEGLMGLISCRCHLVFLMVGRGNVTSSAVAACMELTGNPDTCQYMRGDTDFDAGPVLDGTCTMETLTRYLRQLVTGAASGYKPKSETLGHKGHLIPYEYWEKKVIRPRGR